MLAIFVVAPNYPLWGSIRLQAPTGPLQHATVTSRSLSKIPEDVERLIVEAAMEDFVLQAAGRPSRIPALVTTCRRFKAWSYPIFYRSIYIGAKMRTQCLERTLVACPSLARLVRILVFQDMARFRDAGIIASCRGLKRLFYAYGNVPCLPRCDLSNHTALVRISCNPSFLGLRTGVRPTPNSLIMRITHLDVNTDDHKAWYPTLAHLVNLSHLFIVVENLSPDGSDVVTLLPCLPTNLQVCILSHIEALPDESLSLTTPLAVGEVDPRIVVAIHEDCSTTPYPCIRRRDLGCLALDWGMFHTGLDFWEEAEAIIRARAESSRTTT